MKTKTLLGCWALATLCAASGFGQSVSTVVSSGLSEPTGLVLVDSSTLYITDAAKNQVLKYATSTGVLTVLAGSNVGQTGSADSTIGLNARFSNPQGMIAARGGLVVADSFNNCIRFVGFNGTVTTIAGTAGASAPYLVDAVGTAARFLYPVGLAVDENGIIYVADYGNNAIRAIAADNTVTTIITGLNQPTAVAVGEGVELWVADRSNRLFIYNRAGAAAPGLTIGTGAVGTNDDVAVSAEFNRPSGLLWMGTGAGLLVSDTLNHSVRRVYTNIDQGTYVVSTVAGVPTQSGLQDGATNTARFNNPMGLANDPLNGAFMVADSQNKAVREIQQSAPLPTITDPVIGTVNLEIDTAGNLSAKLTQVTSSTFNNDVVIAIKGERGTETLYTFADTPTNPFLDTVPNPGPGAPTAPFYQDGGSSLPPTLIPAIKPDMTVKAIGSASDRKPSAVVKARFQFKVATPSIVGDNAASFVFSNWTDSAEMYYTTDGSEPTNVPSATVFGPKSAGEKISLNLGNSNLLVKVRAFRSNYQPSEIVSNLFSATNFSANRISFGFSSGEASSDFVGSAGQTFAAPVTLTLLSGTAMYSLQFNLSATNDTGSPVVAPGALGFKSSLMALVPAAQGSVFTVIPPAMFNGSGFTSLLTTNTSLNLLSVGWLERATETNLYNSLLQDLITYSLPHDTLFESKNGRVVVGNFFFKIPATATAGQTYTITIGRPSATADGIREDLFIDAPTNGSMTAGSPINAVKAVTVGTRKYLVGDAAPFRWFNAGDFGDTNLLNNDVQQVFNSAVYDLNTPPKNTDFFDCMDSSDGSLGALDGDDTSINNIMLGDGQLNVDDVFVTFRRSLDPSLSNYFRYWSGGVRVAELYNGSVYRGAGRSVSKNTTVSTALIKLNASTEPPAVSFDAGDVMGGAGQTLQVPITAKIAGPYPVRYIMMNLNVRALDGAPQLTDRIQFTPAQGLGQPYTSSSINPNNYAAVWLDDTVAGISGTNNIGVLTIKIPTNAPANAAYAIVFDHISASPNGLRLFPKQVRTGLITLADRSASSLGDSLPDAWRLRYFGSVSNLLSQADADADGDGISNLAEYRAGTDPNDASSKLQMKSPRASGANDFVVHWSSVSGKQYIVERSATLFEGHWDAVSPTLNGTGWDMEFHDTTPGSGLGFYRVRVVESTASN